MRSKSWKYLALSVYHNTWSIKIILFEINSCKRRPASHWHCQIDEQRLIWKNDNSPKYNLKIFSKLIFYGPVLSILIGLSEMESVFYLQCSRNVVTLAPQQQLTAVTVLRATTSGFFKLMTRRKAGSWWIFSLTGKNRISRFCYFNYQHPPCNYLTCTHSFFILFTLNHLESGWN